MGGCLSGLPNGVLNSEVNIRDAKKYIQWTKNKNPELQCRGAQAIARLAENDGDQVLLVKKGALPPLSLLLQSNYVDVQRGAAAALANLALAEENQLCVAREIGIGTIIALACSPDEQVQRHAAGAIANLVYRNPTMEVEIVVEGGLSPLIQLSKSPDPTVVCEAVAALANLARNPNNRERMAEPDILQPLLQLALHVSNEETERQTTRALTNLSLTESNKRVIVSAGGTKALILALASSNVEVVRLAATALANLSGLPANARPMVEEGVIPPLIPWLAKSEHEAVQAQVLRAIVNLSVLESNTPHLIQHGAVRVLKMLEQRPNADIREMAQRALDNVERGQQALGAAPAGTPAG
eukprot:jgi/Mesvir1/335/Mv22742-RA.1